MLLSSCFGGNGTRFVLLVQYRYRFTVRGRMPFAMDLGGCWIISKELGLEGCFVLGERWRVA